jgi:hypothetical protein
LFKWTAVLAVAPFLALPLGKPGPQRRRWLLALLGGAALPLAVTFFWLHRGGAWEAYLDIQRGFVAPYARIGANSVWKRVQRLFGYTLPWLGKMWVPVLLAALGGWKGRDWRPGARKWVLLSLLGALFSVSIQDKYFGYHWLPLLPTVSLLAASGSAWLWSQWRERPLTPHTPHPTPYAAGLALVVASLALWHGGEYVDAARYAGGSLSSDRWLRRFGPPFNGDFSYLADTWAAAYVRAHTRSGDPVLVWGFEPPVYILSGRDAPTRFFFDVPLTVRFAPEAWRAEFLRDLQARPPALFLVLRNDRIPWATGRKDDSTAQLAEWPELSGWLAAHYRRETEIEDFTVYRRR